MGQRIELNLAILNGFPDWFGACKRILQEMEGVVMNFNNEGAGNGVLPDHLLGH